MDKQELEKLEQLVAYIRKWCDENHSYKQSIPFGQVLRVVSLQAAAIDELTKHGGFMPQRTTIEEKVAKAVFYVDSDGRHSISNRRFVERTFIIYNEHKGEYMTIHFDQISADAYFRDTVRL